MSTFMKSRPSPKGQGKIIWIDYQSHNAFYQTATKLLINDPSIIFSDGTIDQLYQIIREVIIIQGRAIKALAWQPRVSIPLDWDLLTAIDHIRNGRIPGVNNCSFRAINVFVISTKMISSLPTCEDTLELPFRIEQIHL